MRALRIASLLPTATEILCAMGLKDQIVGISHECDFPGEIRSLPVLTSPKIDPSQSGAEIDNSVRELSAQGLSLYHIHEEILAELKPDLIITQDQCEVCAVSLKEVEDAVCRLTLQKTKICSLNPHTLKDVIEDLKKVGLAAGIPSSGVALAKAFQRDLQAIRKQTETFPTPRVLFLEWLEPPMIAGGYLPELARFAGGAPLIVEEPTRFQTVSWGDVLACDPDCVVIFPCGYPIEKTKSEVNKPQAQSFLRSLRAVQSGKAFLCDGNAYFNRPGPRLIDSAKILAGLFHEPLKEWLRPYQSSIFNFTGPPRNDVPLL